MGNSSHMSRRSEHEWSQAYRIWKSEEFLKRASAEIERATLEVLPSKEPYKELYSIQKDYPSRRKEISARLASFMLRKRSILRRCDPSAVA